VVVFTSTSIGTRTRVPVLFPTTVSSVAPAAVPAGITTET
jgi:hypothetical protein